MRNILIIGMIVIAMGYMFTLMFDRYENIKKTNSEIESRK